MSNEASPKCPQCGAPLPADAPAGLCPNCLMALNLKTETVLTGDPTAAQPPLPPEQFAPHFPQLEILECLGRGGMGVVYKARQKSLNRLVALKLLAPERVTDAKFAERFTREAHALAALNHPHIVTIHDFGQAGGFYFLLMEFVDGVNLRQLLESRRLTPEEALAIVPPLCDALQYAHEHGIVHRDIKPANLLLDKAGRVKIADFGIAKMVGENSSVGVAESQPAGTPQYMAPEQKEQRRTDHRADIYSLGVVLYEMLTGELPADKLQPPSSRLRGMQIDVRLDEIVLRALEKTPEMRYQTAGEMRTQVETITHETPKAEGRRTAESPTESGAVPTSRDRPVRGTIWLKILSFLVLLASVPVIGLGLFFFVGIASEQGGWHPAPAEAVVVLLTWLGMFLLPLAGIVLWQFARSRNASGGQVPRPLWQSPAACFALSYLALIGLLFATAGMLPEPVAMHYDAAGDPDNFCPRFWYLLFMGILPGLLSALFVGLARLAMRQPALLKIPHRDHWLAPEHRAELGGVLLRWMLWLACLETGFFGVLHWLIVLANTLQPPNLAPGRMLGLVIGSLSVLPVWLVTFVLRLAKGSSRDEYESQTQNAAMQTAVTPFKSGQFGDPPAAPALLRSARVIGVLLPLCFGCIIVAIFGWRVLQSKNVEANALHSQALAQGIGSPAAKGESTRLVTATGSLAPVPGSPTKWLINALVAEADIASVKIGQDVSFTLDAFPQGISLGKIAEVGRTPITGKNSVTYETIIDVTQGAAAESKFKPGMTVSVTFIVEAALLQPESTSVPMTGQYGFVDKPGIPLWAMVAVPLIAVGVVILFLLFFLQRGAARKVALGVAGGLLLLLGVIVVPIVIALVTWRASRVAPVRQSAQAAQQQIRQPKGNPEESAAASNTEDELDLQRTRTAAFPKMEKIASGGAVTRSFPLRHELASEMAEDLRQILLGKPGQGAKPFADNQEILVTAPPEVLARAQTFITVNDWPDPIIRGPDFQYPNDTVTRAARSFFYACAIEDSGEVFTKLLSPGVLAQLKGDTKGKEFQNYQMGGVPDPDWEKSLRADWPGKKEIIERLVREWNCYPLKRLSEDPGIAIGFGIKCFCSVSFEGAPKPFYQIAIEPDRTKPSDRNASSYLISSLPPWWNGEATKPDDSEPAHAAANPGEPTSAALVLSYQQFDQTPHSGWRVLAQDDKRFREAAALIEAYLLHNGLRIDERVNLHFHAAQCLAFAGDAKSVLEAIGHLKQSRFAAELPDAFLIWNEYVNATEAFLKGDLDALKAARELIAIRPKLNAVAANLDVVDRLIARFGQPYRQAYSGEPEDPGTDDRGIW